MSKTLLQTISRLGIADHEALSSGLGLSLLQVDQQLRQLLNSGFISGSFSPWRRDRTRLYSIARDIMLTPAGADYLASAPPAAGGISGGVHIENVSGPVQVSGRDGHQQADIRTVADFLEALDREIQTETDHEPGVIEAGRDLIRALQKHPLVRAVIKRVLRSIGVDLAE